MVEKKIEYVPGIGRVADAKFYSTPPNPWGGKSISEIRAMEYKRNPKMKPKEQGFVDKSKPVDPRLDAFLKDYIKQMRAGGYSDFQIKQKLLSEGSITIPDSWNPGDEAAWTGGMKDERFKSVIDNTRDARGVTTALPGVTRDDLLPSTGELQSFKAGTPADRLPTYGEYSGRTQSSPFLNLTGKFAQNKQAGLVDKLAEYLSTYNGPVTPMSQWAAESGMAGLPNELVSSWMPEKSALDAYDARALKQGDEEAQRAITEQDRAAAVYQQFAGQYPRAGILPTDTVPEMIAKMAEYQTTEEYLKAYEKAMPSEKETAAYVMGEIINKFIDGTFTPELAFQYALSQGVTLDYDELLDKYSIFAPPQEG